MIVSGSVTWATPSRSSPAMALTSGASASSESVKLMTPGPDTSTPAHRSASCARSTPSAAISRGLRPSRLARANAPSAWKSACCDLRRTGSAGPSATASNAGASRSCSRCSRVAMTHESSRPANPVRVDNAVPRPADHGRTGSPEVDHPILVGVPRPLCVLLPEIGVVSETFIRWDVHDLLPGGTVVIADPPPAGDSVRHGPAWASRDCPTLAFEPLPGDSAPGPERVSAVASFLAEHQVKAVLVEYLDFADRWLDVLLGLGVDVWLRGHGVDLSARLTEQHWRQAYRRYDRANGIIVPSDAAAAALSGTGLPSDKIHVVRYCVELPPWRPVRNGDDQIRCVAAGRLVPKKAPLQVLASFRQAAQTNEHMVLDVVGDGPLMGEVRSYVAGHGPSRRVRLHGRLPHPDTLALIRGADLLLHHAVTSAE